MVTISITSNTNGSCINGNPIAGGNQFGSTFPLIGQSLSSVTVYGLNKEGDGSYSVRARVYDSSGAVQATSTNSVAQNTLPSSYDATSGQTFDFTSHTLAADDRLVVEYTTSWAGGNRICFGLGACSAGCTGVVSTTNNGSSWTQNSSFVMPMLVNASESSGGVLLPPPYSEIVV